MVKSCDYDWETLLVRSATVHISFMKPAIEFDATEHILREKSSTISDLLDGDASVANDGKDLKISLPFDVCTESLKPIVIILKMGRVSVDSDTIEKYFPEMYVIASYLGIEIIIEQLKEAWASCYSSWVLDVFQTSKFKEMISDDHFRELMECAKLENPQRFQISTLGPRDGKETICSKCQIKTLCHKYSMLKIGSSWKNYNHPHYNRLCDAYDEEYVCSECNLKSQIEEKKYLSMLKQWAFRKENNWDMQMLMTGIGISGKYFNGTEQGVARFKPLT